MFINKAILYGNLTRDPELKMLPGGTGVASFSLATNHIYKDKDGNKQEKADFHNIVVFGAQADSVAKWLKKGSSAFIEGRIQTRSYDKDGVKQYRTEIIADKIQFGPRAGGGSSEASYGAPAPGAPVATPKHDMPAYPTEDISPEDIPF